MKPIKSIEWDGVQITKPGIYHGIPLDLYHHPDICKGPSISSTGLRALFGDDTSPRHFYAKWRGNPAYQPPDKEPRHFIIGRALHHLVLGEPYFQKMFTIQPSEWPDNIGLIKPWNNNRKECRKWHAEQSEAGLSVLTVAEADAIRQMAISLRNHPLGRHLRRGLIERSVFWKDKETGIWLKWRPDTMPTDSADYVDLKTCRSVTGPAISTSIDRFKYYQQAALGRDATRIVLDMAMETFTLLFVEKQVPWSTRDIRCDEQDLDRGARANRAAIRTFAKCLHDKRWPGPGEGNEFNERIGMSAAARERIDTALKYEGLADGVD